MVNKTLKRKSFLYSTQQVTLFMAYYCCYFAVRKCQSMSIEQKWSYYQHFS